MIVFIDEYRDIYGVEPICRVLPIALSAYYAHTAIARNPELASDRAKQDVIDAELMAQAHRKSCGRYGSHKIWHQLRREGHEIARCTIERLMQAHGLEGVTRGKCGQPSPIPPSLARKTG
jgi:hypothetical protein